MSFKTALIVAKVVGVIVGVVSGIFDFIVCGALGGITVGLCDLWGWTDFTWWKVGIAAFAFSMVIRKVIDCIHIAESKVCMEGIHKILEEEDMDDDEDEDGGEDE